MLTRRSLLIGAPAALALARPAHALSPNQQLILSGNGPPPWVLQGAVAPAIDFDFAGSRYWQQGKGANQPAANLMTTSRASTGYAADTSGNWYNFASNVARITNQGLLVEEARTNSIRNNSMQGAAAGSPGTLPTNWASGGAAGLTRTIVGTGTSLGIDYIDVRLAGTSGGTFSTFFFEPATQIVASNGQTWDQSIFLAVVGGSTANITLTDIIIRPFDSGGIALGDIISSDLTGSLTSALQRFSLAGTMSSASTAFVLPAFAINYSSAVAIDITLRIGWPQLELGSFATSPIRTTSAAVTRAADLVTVTNVPAFGGAGSLFVSGISEIAAKGSGAFYVFVSDGTNNNRIVPFRSFNGNYQSIISVSGSDIFNPTAVFSILPGKTSMAWSAGSQASYLNGSLVGTASSASNPSGLNRIDIGNGLGTAHFDGYISRIAIWPTTRQPNAVLQALTQ